MRISIVPLLLFPISALADPSPPPECSAPVAQRQEGGGTERIFTLWPNGQPKGLTVTRPDKTSVELHYTADGVLELESHHDAHHKAEGVERRWHEDGKLFVCALHRQNKKTGTWIYYDRSGDPAAAFTYEDDREVEHLTYSRRFGWQPFAAPKE